MGANIRIKDIARLSGVSPGTVDRVLHNRGRVSEDALKKVMVVLDQIDYKPNWLARTLASNQTIRLATLLPNPEQDPYWQQSWSGILQAQQDWAYYNVTMQSFFFDLYDKESFQSLTEEVLDANPHGILIAPIFHHQAIPFLEKLRETGIPFVFFNTLIPEVKPLSFIGQDLYQSGRVCGELMYLGFAQPGQNHFAVLHIVEDIHNSVHLAEKERGFRDYLEEKCTTCTIETLNLNNSYGDQIRTLLEHPYLRGIFVSTSKATYLTATVLSDSKPELVGLAGYDLLDENIEHLKNGTLNFLISQNPKRQARVGIHHLVNHLFFNKQLPERDLFPLEIITRENVQSYLHSEIH